MVKIDLKGMDRSEMEQWAINYGLDAYRGRQIRQWLFSKMVSSFRNMTNIPKVIREALEQDAVINNLWKIRTLASNDGTKKYLFRLWDGCVIESVLIPERRHFTLCISSQVGCAMACRFCLTGKQGFTRNLTPSEIIDQIIEVKRSLANPADLKNIVFMGMGEPLANYDAVVKAIKNIVGADGLNFSTRKVTVSTCGLVPNLIKLGLSDVTVNLAVSLNATDNKTRSFLMPVNKKYPIEELIAACREFPLPNRRMITFEYILIKDVNDSVGDAYRLCRLLSGMRAKINLIPLNPHLNLDLVPTPMNENFAFQDILASNNFTAMIRKSKGADIMAACGQLSGEYLDSTNETFT